MARYQFDLEGSLTDVAAKVKTACAQSCKISKEPTPNQFVVETVNIPNKRIEGENVTFTFFLAERGGKIRICATSNPEYVGLCEKPWDLIDKRFSLIIEALLKQFPYMNLVASEPYLINAEICGTGVGEEVQILHSVKQTAGHSWSRDVAMAAAKGKISKRTAKTVSREVFTRTVPARLFYSNGRIIEKLVIRNSPEYVEIITRFG